MVILITGGAGFIGSHLAERLLRQGNTVLCVDNLDDYLYSSALKRENIELLSAYPAFRFIEEDIRNKEALRQLMLEYGCEAVYHLAAYAGVRASVEVPEKFMEVNINGTLAVLEAMREAKVNKLVFASSSSVYGNTTHSLFKETDAADRPISPYAASKRAAELLAYSYHSLYGFQITCLRLFTVYGPRQRPEMAIRKFIDRLLDEEPIELYGNGLTYRNYTFVGDAVQGFIKALEHSAEGFRVYNIGGAKSISLEEVITTLEHITGKKSVIIYRPEQAGDVRHTAADISRAKKELGYAPEVTLEEGIRRYMKWLPAALPPVNV